MRAHSTSDTSIFENCKKIKKSAELNIHTHENSDDNSNTNNNDNSDDDNNNSERAFSLYVYRYMSKKISNEKKSLQVVRASRSPFLK